MASHAEWDQHTTATEVAAAFAGHIQGRTVAITGVSPKSIGAATALAIASQSPSLLVLASRTESNLAAVASSIRAAHPRVPVLCIPLDLSSFASVRQGAAQIGSAVGPAGGLDVLINNAGINVPTHQFTSDGHELQWQTNHLGPFLLTALLMPALRAAAARTGAAPARVVNVSSAGHVLCPVRFSDTGFTRSIGSLPQDERPGRRTGKLLPKEGETYSGFLAYAQGKTANVLMAVHMAREFGRDGVQAFSVHPGSIWTDLSRHLDEELTRLIAATSSFWKTLDQGAATTLVAAFDPALGAANGAYLSDCQVDKPAPHASSPEAAQRLWRLSEQQTQSTLAVL